MIEIPKQTKEEDQILKIFPKHIYLSKLNITDDCLNSIDKYVSDFDMLLDNDDSQTKEQHLLDKEELHPLREVILEKAKTYGSMMQLKYEDLWVSNSWLNKMEGNPEGKNTGIHSHVHPNCLMAGCIYLTDNNSNLNFETSHVMDYHLFDSDTNDALDNFSIQPEKLQIIIFPSQLPHSVDKVFKGVRKSICFNIAPLGKFGMHNAYVNFSRYR